MNEGSREGFDRFARHAAAEINARAERLSASSVAPTRDSRRASRTLLAAAASVVLLLAVGIGVWWPGGADGPQHVTVEPPPRATDQAGDDAEDAPAEPRPEQRCAQRVTSFEDDVGWQLSVDDAALTRPVVAGGMVYVGDTSEGGCLFAVDEQTGDLVWTVPGRAVHGGSPLVVGGRLLVPFEDELTALDLESGDVLWSAEIRPQKTLQVVGELVLTVAWGDGGDGNVLHALHLENGDVEWTVEEVWEPLLVHDDVPAVRGRGGMQLLDLPDGEVVGEVAIEGGRWPTRLLDDTFLTHRPSNYHGLVDASSGELLWETNVPGAASTGQVVVGGRLVVAADVGEVFGIDMDTRNYDWRTDVASLPSPNPARGMGPEPAHTGTTLYLGTEDGVFAIDATSGEILWRNELGEALSPTLHHDDVVYLAVDGRGVVALDPANGRELWSAEPDAEGLWPRRNHQLALQALVPAEAHLVTRARPDVLLGLHLREPD
jgi:outer membrane protein assembly factor BamB